MSGLADVADCWIVDPARTIPLPWRARGEALARCSFKRFALASLSMGGHVAQDMYQQVPSAWSALSIPHLLGMRPLSSDIFDGHGFYVYQKR